MSSRIRDEWLIKIMEGEDPKTIPKPLIQRAARTLREIESNKSCFDPLVVSLGPYHHKKKDDPLAASLLSNHHKKKDDDRLQAMESYKEVAARWFFSLSGGNKSVKEANVVYHKFVAKVTRESSPKDYYADHQDDIGEEDFMQMMFLDGCFILHFIHLVLNGRQSSHLVQPQLILRDMFLLENQIPYTILKALEELMTKKNGHEGESSSSQSNESNDSIDIEKFIDMVFLAVHEPPRPWKRFYEIWNFIKEMSGQIKSSTRAEVPVAKLPNKVGESEPCHLLDLLRSKLIGVDDKEGGDVNGTGEGNSSPACGYWHYFFRRSIMELKTAGIKVKRSKSKYLKDMQFQSGRIHSHLELPTLLVDDVTKARLLNLIAYEMCLADHSNREVTSYICFLDSLIYHAEDVKELRSKNILLNRLGSDEEVAKLFNELANNNLTPNCSTYTQVMEDIEEHSKHYVKAWIAQSIAQFVDTHFTSPWTVIALIAGIVALVLTLIQTIYTAGSYYKGED